MLKNTRIASALASFHNEEDGVEAIQVVLILAIAAVALLAVRWAWNEAPTGSGEGGINKFFNTNVKEALDVKYNKEGA